jgi:hypothetical protein
MANSEPYSMTALRPEPRASIISVSTSTTKWSGKRTVRLDAREAPDGHHSSEPNVPQP